ncbi:MAG: hypothetical protein ACFFCE_05695 [Promethearchaeota archaeon]
MTGNKSSRLVWAYQSGVGVEAIDDADDTTYFFGEFDESCGDWTLPSIVNDVEEYYSYDSRESNITPIRPKYKPFKINFLPITPQYICWFLKQVTKDGGGANIHNAEVLDTGLPLPITIRDELNDGSVDRLAQAVDCYMIKLGCTAMEGAPFLVESEWIFGRLEDDRGQWKADDTVASVVGNDITLTDEPQRAVDYYNGWLVFVSGGDNEDETFNVEDSDASDPPVLTLDSTPNANLAGDTIKLFDKERPRLTTDPSNPGYNAENCYNGKPDVYWDVADQNIHFLECWKAQWYQEQEYKVVLDNNSKYGTVYLYKHKTIQLTLEAVLERKKIWTDYIDREARQINITVYKPDENYYVTHEFYNCYVVDVQETGHQFEGFYNARIFLKAESIDVDFTIEDQTNWSTHYKHVS